MRLLTAILAPTGGDAWVAGFHVVRDTEAIKSSIGYMSQRFGLYADLTVMENMGFFAGFQCVSERDQKRRIPELLEFAGLGGFTERLAGRLSGGMNSAPAEPA